MRAVIQREIGSADVLRVEDLPDPEPGSGQVRIAVEAAGIHLLDTYIRAGSGPAGPPELPMVPGREVAGVVDRVGDGVPGSLVGRRVVAHLGPTGRGGYAEQVVVDAARAYDIPEELDTASAVAAIGTGRTAAGVLDHARIGPDDVVVITSAAGGLGLLLVQGARNAGARVVGLASGSKLGLVREFGADTVVDYRDPGWAAALRTAEPRLTVLLDGVGSTVPRTVHAMLAPGGRTIRFSGDVEGYDVAGRTVVDVLGPAITSRLAEFEKAALEAAANRSRVPYVGSVFPLEDAAAAHRALENRSSVGKVVLAVHPRISGQPTSAAPHRLTG